MATCAVLTLWLATLASRPARVEAFLVEQATARGPEPVAVVTLRSLEREGGLLLEQDVTFRENGVTILHDEWCEADGWHLVRRELRGEESPGRSWITEPDESGGTRLLCYGSSAPVHASLGEGAPRVAL